MSGGPWTVRWIRDWDEALGARLDGRLRAAYGAGAGPNVFYRPPVLRAWVESYRRLGGIEARFAEATTSSGGWALVPLVLRRRGWKRGWVRELAPAGWNEFDYHDPVVSGAADGAPAPEELWRAVIEQVLAGSAGPWDRLLVPRVRAAYPAWPAHGVAAEEVAPYLDLRGAGGYEEVERRLRGSVRADLRRCVRRLEEKGAVTLRVFGAGEVEAALASLAGLLEEHRRRWPLAWRAPGFHEGLVRLGLPEGVVHLSELRVGDAPVSRHLGLRSGGRFCWYLPAFDPAWSRFAPGRIHLSHAIAQVLASGGETFDLLRGDEPYKSEWTRDVVRLHPLEVRATRGGARVRRALGAIASAAAQALRGARPGHAGGRGGRP